MLASWCTSYQRRSIVVLLGFATSACTPVGPQTAATTPPPPAATLSAAPTAPPVWQVGDRWVFEWTTGATSGTKTVSVLGNHEIGGVRYYVVRIGDLEHYYTADLRWAFAVRDSKVEARMVPARPWFVWPLDAGGSWQHRGSFEDPRGKVLYVDTFRALGVEPVEVPAGRFQALRILRESEGGETDEYWYAPEVRWYVRWVGRRPDVSFEERLKSYDPVPRPS